MTVLIAIAPVSMYWQTVVLLTHIFKPGACDIDVLLRHYDVVSLSGIYVAVYDSKGQWLSGDLCRR